MGLDMSLLLVDYNDTNKQEIDLPILKTVYELAYWRKHPNLHGFIVQTFAKGIDDCQSILLQKDDIDKIINAIRNNQLPETHGFFFGASSETEEQKNIDIRAFEKALKYLDAQKPPNVWYREIQYEASW